MNKKRGSIRLGKVLGIEVNLHFTWFLILALLVWGLSTGFFPIYYPELSRAASWILGFAAAVLLFVSVFLHELMHSIAAKMNRMKVESITLFFFGGVASIPGERLTPKKEFQMAIAGPLFSLVLGVIFYGIYAYSASVYLTAVSSYLWRINFILAAFNMFPGFPLDGGRVFRAILWHVLKDIKKATRIAVYGGKVFAILLIAFGFIGMIFGGTGGLWFIFIGFFLYYIAGASYEQTVLHEALSKVKVSELVNEKPVAVKADITAGQLFSKFLKLRKESFMVAKDNKIAGVVSVNDLKKVRKEELNKVKVSDIMSKDVRAVSKEDSLYDALMKMVEKNVDILPVKSGSRVTGIISREDIIRYARMNI